MFHIISYDILIQNYYLDYTPRYTLIHLFSVQQCINALLVCSEIDIKSQLKEKKNATEICDLTSSTIIKKDVCFAPL